MKLLHSHIAHLNEKAALASAAAASRRIKTIRTTAATTRCTSRNRNRSKSKSKERLHTSYSNRPSSACDKSTKSLKNRLPLSMR